jgi:DNA-binding winged helix-turn-helix (wHTH) protein/tetratricopeptide (TPR) repeat protein
VRVRFAGFDLDEANATLARDGKPLALAPTPFALLCALARQPGALLSKDALLDQVWGHQFVSESVLKTAISDLRTILGDDARQPRLIETVPRRGYRFIAVPIAQPPGPGRAVPAASPAQDSGSFVGRADALARLDSAWERAQGGTRSLAWVTGEPGIGKTTLIEHFISCLGDVACARGQCVEHYGTGEPYLPVLEALSDLCRRDSALPPLLRAVAPTWLLQLPWLSTAEEREALRRELAGVGPERMLREMGELLDRYTGERPLLLVTEDLHWSDRSTLHLIDYIARRRGGARLMWLASFRLAEVVALEHPLNPLRHELRLHRLCDEIVLDPFSEREIADYVAAAAPALAADVAFVRGLHERTDGVPLFVASVMADLSDHAESGGDAAVAREALANVAVPENLAAIIDHYIARLGSDERALLSTAAICGMDFRAETIAGAIERDPAWVAETCERLARARVWVAAPHGAQDGEGAERPYTFRHTLFRQVLYERTAPATRAQLHRNVGAALERERQRGVPVAAAQLAMHFDRGREPMTALRYYAEAAEAALRSLSAEECLVLTERALGLLDSAGADAGAARSSLEIMLCTMRGMAAFRLRGVGAESKSAYRRAYALLPDAPGHRARELLTHGLCFVLCQRAEYDEALTVAEHAAAHANTAGVPLLLVTASNVEGQVHMMQGRPRAARARLERALPAIAAADPVADRQVAVVPQVLLLALLAVQLFHLGLVRQARDRLQEARLRALEVNVPMARLVVLWLGALLEVRLGHADRVSALADEMRNLVDETALAQGGAASEWFRGWADARRGDAKEGYRRIRAAYEANTALGMLAGGSEVLGYAAEALVLAGDLEGAERELRHALEVARAQDERIYLPRLYLTEAAIARGRRDPAAADEALRRALAEAREQEAPWHVLVALVDLCEHGNAEVADLDALATLLAHLPEAADTGPALRARELINARAPAPAASTTRRRS